MTTFPWINAYVLLPAGVGFMAAAILGCEKESAAHRALLTIGMALTGANSAIVIFWLLGG